MILGCFKATIIAMSMLKIVIYSTRNGKKPYLEWRDSLDGKTRSIILTRIDRVSINNFGDCKQIKNGGGIWELRINFGPGYRIYFGKEGTTLILLLVGGNKTTQNRDIEKAKKFWLEYKESQNE